MKPKTVLLLCAVAAMFFVHLVAVFPVAAAPSQWQLPAGISFGETEASVIGKFKNIGKLDSAQDAYLGEGDSKIEIRIVAFRDVRFDKFNADLVMMLFTNDSLGKVSLIFSEGRGRLLSKLWGEVGTFMREKVGPPSLFETKDGPNFEWYTSLSTELAGALDASIRNDLGKSLKAEWETDKIVADAIVQAASNPDSNGPDPDSGPSLIWNIMPGMPSKADSKPSGKKALESIINGWYDKKMAALEFIKPWKSPEHLAKVRKSVGAAAFKKAWCEVMLQTAYAYPSMDLSSPYVLTTMVFQYGSESKTQFTVIQDPTSGATKGIRVEQLDFGWTWNAVTEYPSLINLRGKNEIADCSYSIFVNDPTDITVN